MLQMDTQRREMLKLPIFCLVLIAKNIQFLSDIQARGTIIAYKKQLLLIHNILCDGRYMYYKKYYLH